MTIPLTTALVLAGLFAFLGFIVGVAAERAANGELRSANRELHEANKQLREVQRKLAAEQRRIASAAGISLPPVPIA